MKTKVINRIGVLTSGGDSPGMNAAIRSVVRYALHNNIQVLGILRGYAGLINDEVILMDHRSVSNIINRGGTILKTARCEEFKTRTGQRRAVEVIKKHDIDALVVIGGDGSYRGAQALFKNWGIPTVGMPGTIDNDVCGTERTIGCNTAMNTALEAIDKIRDTATSLERIFVVEVMGRHSGYIAINVAIGAGAEECLIPEKKFSLPKMCKDIEAGEKKGKSSWIIVVAEGAASGEEVAKKITQVTKLETRVTVLGHIQRGGTPTATDRILATYLGAAAVDLLIKGRFGKAVGIIGEKLSVVDLGVAIKKRKINIDALYRLIRIVT
jgi:6-phosphofructokinase 1